MLHLVSNHLPILCLGDGSGHTRPPYPQTGQGRRQGTRPGSQPRTTTERLQANHSTRPGPRSPPGKMGTAWPSWPVTKTSSGQLLRPPETRPAMPTAATQGRQTGTERNSRAGTQCCLPSPSFVSLKEFHQNISSGYFFKRHFYRNTSYHILIFLFFNICHVCN